MKLHTILLALCPIFFMVSTNSIAESSACEAAIEEKYSGNYQDRYGNKSSTKVEMLQSMGTYAPGQHSFGNNNAHFYVAQVDRYENGQLKKRDSMALWCVVNSTGKVLGVEREFN